jgi:hypothetical protein
MFFFEKKNQKTFAGCRALSLALSRVLSLALSRAPAGSAPDRDQKFFASFFKKEESS